MKRKKITKKKFTKKDCGFCQNKTVPDYKDAEKLRRFISERGRILPRAYTGVCAKHMKKLSVAIKRARHLAYLPFIAS
jgi:small subunit ribosomal protein S18